MCDFLASSRMHEDNTDLLKVDAIYEGKEDYATEAG